MLGGRSMTISIDKPKKGDIVSTPRGAGTVVDSDWAYREVAVRHYGEDHHQWFLNKEVFVEGYNPNAWVWSGPNQVLAHQLRH
jgi:hypothetical protein